MDIFPHVNLIVIGLWLIFFVAVPAWCELKASPFRGHSETASPDAQLKYNPQQKDRQHADPDSRL